MPETDPNKASFLAGEYRLANPAMLEFLQAAAALYQDGGKKNWFGVANGPAAASAFRTQFTRVVFALMHDKKLNLTDTKKHNLELIDGLVKTYQLAYPNWQEAYFIWNQFYASQINVAPNAPWRAPFV
jgi:hypothetical protein